MADWPDATDFTNAVKNPSTCFHDPILQSGTTEMSTRKKRPLRFGGNFASVYKIKSNGEFYAARCFTIEVTDQQIRYDLISKHIGVTGISCLVGFEYIEKGIQVKGEWYPIVKMDWVEGDQLHKFVEKNLQNPSTLRYLVARFNGFVGNLQGNKTAHCDLQHGNIIVNGNAEPNAVDYDAMWTQEIENAVGPAHEMGRSEYQHPERDDTHSGLWVDNFSAITIYLSLGALAVEPDLWKFHNGDNLIFVGSDFQDPQNSPAFHALKNTGDPIVGAMTEELESYCHLPIEQVPSLKEVIVITGAFQSGTRPAKTSSTSSPSQPQQKTPPPQPQPAISQQQTATPPPPLQQPVATPIAMLTSAQHDFKQVVEGETGTWDFEIKNLGSADLIVQSINSSDQQFDVSYNPAPIPANGGARSVTVEFQPQSIGFVNATLTVETNDKQLTVNVSGEGIVKSEPKLSVARTPTDFGQIGQYLKEARTIRVSNKGTGDLEINRIETSNFLTLETILPLVLLPDDDVDISMTAVLENLGQQNGEIKIYSNDPRGVQKAKFKLECIPAQDHVVNFIYPEEINQGDKDIPIVINGSLFPAEDYLYISFGPRIKVKDKETIDEKQIQVSLDVSPDAGSGLRTVNVVNTLTSVKAEAQDSFEVVEKEEEAPEPEIVSITPDKFFPGQRIPILSIQGENFERVVSFPKIIRDKRVETGTGKNKVTTYEPVEIEDTTKDPIISEPMVVSDIVGFGYDELGYLSESSIQLRNVAIPRTCAVDTYYLKIVNPGKGKKEAEIAFQVEALASSQVPCKSCGELMEKPPTALLQGEKALTKDQQEKWYCPACHWHQAIDA